MDSSQLIIVMEKSAAMLMAIMNCAQQVNTTATKLKSAALTIGKAHALMVSDVLTSTTITLLMKQQLELFLHAKCSQSSSPHKTKRYRMDHEITPFGIQR